jgi:hypothetical protein
MGNQDDAVLIQEFNFTKLKTQQPTFVQNVVARPAQFRYPWTDNLALKPERDDVVGRLNFRYFKHGRITKWLS